MGPRAPAPGEDTMRSARILATCAQRALLAVALASMGCATAPVHRPIGPPIGAHALEAGVGGHGIISQDHIGGGGSTWGLYQFIDRADVLVRAHAAELVALTDTNKAGLPVEDEL